ncbi:MAG TPA: ABC transporter permease, partial [Kineosporiaceae bacterium]|nr:ABC transporter permease [Kineosporiaceae bacterium]
VFSLAVTTVVLLFSHTSPLDDLRQMLDYAGQPRTQALIVNSATTYYLAAVAVAIGFRMNLFNIGVDGQYRLAAMIAASVGGAITLSPVLHVGVVIVVAVVVGAAWAAIAAVLKITRGVNEVIGTIMLNYVATAVINYLLKPGRLAVATAGSNNIGTRPIKASGQVPGIALIPGSELKVYGLIVLAALVGFGYWFLLGRTRFGYDLRATGANESAAVASGVNVKRMVVVSMLLSGGLAGLIGLPLLLGSSYSYGLDFPTGPTGPAFTGIAIALLGRNHPVGIAFGALLWGFLDNSVNILQLAGVPKEIVFITEGVIVLSVVVAYEIVRRYRVRAEQQAVGRQLGELTSAPATEGAAA